MLTAVAILRLPWPSLSADETPRAASDVKVHLRRGPPQPPTDISARSWPSADLRGDAGTTASGRESLGASRGRQSARTNCPWLAAVIVCSIRDLDDGLRPSGASRDFPRPSGALQGRAQPPRPSATCPRASALASAPRERLAAVGGSPWLGEPSLTVSGRSDCRFCLWWPVCVPRPSLIALAGDVVPLRARPRTLAPVRGCPFVAHAPHVCCGISHLSVTVGHFVCDITGSRAPYGPCPRPPVAGFNDMCPTATVARDSRTLLIVSKYR